MLSPYKNLMVDSTYTFRWYHSGVRTINNQLHPNIVAYSDLGLDARATVMLKPLKQCGLCARSLHALAGRGILTLGDLVQCNRQQLLRIRNLGVKCADEIEEVVRRYGFQLEEV